MNDNEVVTEVNSSEVPIEEIEAAALEGTELETFEAAEVEDVEFVSEDDLASILESLLFATDRPQSIALLKHSFKGTQIKSQDIRRGLEKLAAELASQSRGVTLEEIKGGYQLRTKADNMKFLKRAVKARPFRLSGPALEVLSIIAYKENMIKSEIDEIRGVESGHLLRGLMDKNLVAFAGKSELPGKPMLYSTTKRFLEVFGLRNLRELPTLSEIDELIPEGIGEEQEEERLHDITEGLSRDAGTTYSEGEEELTKISDELSQITTTSDFFDKEKKRQKEKREFDKAQDIRERQVMEEEVTERELKWLARYEEAQQAAQEPVAETTEAAGEETDVVVAIDGAIAEDFVEKETLQAEESESIAADAPASQDNIIEIESSMKESTAVEAAAKAAASIFESTEMDSPMEAEVGVMEEFSVTSIEAKGEDIELIDDQVKRVTDEFVLKDQILEGDDD